MNHTANQPRLPTHTWPSHLATRPESHYDARWHTQGSTRLLRSDDESAGTTAAFLALIVQPHALSTSWHRLYVEAVTSRQGALADAAARSVLLLIEGDVLAK
jgi:hypothetical protein